MKWIKQVFQRIFTHDSQDNSGNELTHAQNLPELTNADLEFLFTQLLEGVYQARGQQWALRYLQRMENRISEQRWLEWLQMFGKRVLNSPAPNDELAFRMVQLSELNIGSIGEYAGNIGMQLLARTTNPAEWETSEIFDPPVAGDSEPILSTTTHQLDPETNDIKDDFSPSTARSEAVEIPVPPADRNSGNILLDFNFQPQERENYQWEINPEENALISLENTPGQDLLRQFGDELWEVGIEEPAAKTNDSQPPYFDYLPQANNQVESVQLDPEGVPFVEFVSQPNEDAIATGDSSVADVSTEDTIDGTDGVENLAEINVSNFTESEVISPPSEFLESDLVDEDTATAAKFIETEVISPQTESLEGDLVEEDTATAAKFIETEEISKEEPATSNIHEETGSIPIADVTNITEGQETRETEETLVQPSPPPVSAEQQYQIVADNDSLQAWVASPSSESLDDTNENNAAAAAGIPPNLEPTQPDISDGNNNHTDTHDIIPNLPWQPEWTGEQPNVTVTLDELWIRLQQSAHLVEQLAAGLNQSGASQLFLDNSPPPLNLAEEAQKLFFQGLQQSKDGDLDGAIASYHQAVEYQPDAYEYWFNLGLALFYRGDLMESLAAYEQAIAIKDDYYKAWLNRGVTLGELEQFEIAIESFDRVISLKVDEADAWSSRGTALLKLGRIEEAIQSYDIATQHQPNDGQTWFYRGVALANLGEYPDAIASFDEALESEGDYSLIWHQRGIAQVNINQFAEAIYSYDKALELASDNPDIWIARAYALQQNQQVEAAIASYGRALQLNPQLDQIWIDKGVLESSQGYWQDAIASWDKALAISPHLYLAWFNKGVAWDNLGQTDQALQCYDQAIEIEPNFYVGWYNRGLLLCQQQQLEAGILSYDLAIQIQPDYWEAWLARASAVFLSPGSDSYFTSYSALANSNPSLNLRGYDGQLTTYGEALAYLNPETHPEGWGKINLALGNTYYQRGLHYKNPRHDWYHAFDAYDRARVTLTPEIFPEQHLEVLENLIKIYVAFEQTGDAHALHNHARSFLGELLNHPQRDDKDKQRLALKFAGIEQLGADITVQSGELVQALEIGEYGKNACLEWLLGGWKPEILSANYPTIQSLVNPHTAIVYWHMSPIAIHTFIIKHLHPEPIPVFTPILNLDEYAEKPLPEAVERFVKFHNWLEEWQQQYSEYLTLTPEAQREHTWCVDMVPRLLQLKQILSIANIIEELEGITNLILVPHRDLFALPLHALFSLSAGSEGLENISGISDNFHITYLPTLQTVFTNKTPANSPSAPQNLLSVETYDQLHHIAKQFNRLETDMISQLFPCDRIDTNNIQPEILLEKLSSQFDILHFSGVVRENLHHPAKSSFQIGNAEALNISEINPQYQLVTLATHHHQPQTPSINSEYAGIASALLYAGVPHVASNIWETEATTRILMMVEFYRRLQAGKTPIAAFNEANNWLKEVTAKDLQQWYEGLFGSSLPVSVTTYLYKTNQINPDGKLYSHPFHWAGFKIYGGF